jgi:hypothetical protein
VKPAGIEYLKGRINELPANSKTIRNLYVGIREFKTDYQPRSNLVKDEDCGLFANSYNILNRWKNYFSQLLML